MIIRKAGPDQAGRLASLHVHGIETAFLSRLGKPFLELLYRELASSEQVICLAAEDSSGITGFICGTVNTKLFYREFLRRNVFSIAMKLLVAAPRPGIARGIYEHLRHARAKAGSTNLPAAELISMVVREEWRGTGLSKDLLFALAKEFAGQGVTEFKIVAGAGLLTANAFYRKMGLELVEQTEVHSGEISNVYVGHTDRLPQRPLVGGE